MMRMLSSRRARFVLAALAIFAVGSYAGWRVLKIADNGVYSVEYAKPIGWNEGQPGPFTLFVFRHPKGRGVLRGSLNEVHASVNPTPDLDTNGIAQHYVDLTKANMPDWSAKRLDDIGSENERFSVIRREKSDRIVYTAFCAKGNTTVVVSLSAGGKASKSLDELYPEFQKLVSSFRLVPKNLVFDD